MPSWYRDEWHAYAAEIMRQDDDAELIRASLNLTFSKHFPIRFPYSRLHHFKRGNELR